MEDRISIRGRTARKMVKVANHLPLPGGQSQAGQLRAKLYQRERMWECPEHLNLSVISMEHFTMELLSRKREMEDTENNTDDWKLPGIVLQLHGGGYYGRMHNTYRDMAGLYNEISKGYDVLSVDYRVAPEHPYPAALEDALAAYQWSMERGYPLEKLIVAGDSAGGGLALALCLYLRDHDIPLPAGIITMSAWTDLTKSGESYQENFDIDPIFGGTMDSLVYQEGYYKDSNPEIPYISPVNGDYHGFPPMLMQVGEYEMLLSDTKTVARHAMDAGVTVKDHIGHVTCVSDGFIVISGSKRSMDRGWKVYPIFKKEREIRECLR